MRALDRAALANEARQTATDKNRDGDTDTAVLLTALAMCIEQGPVLKQVAWLGPYGVIPGGMDNEPHHTWRPLYVIEETP